MKTLSPTSHRAALADILEFEILEELPFIDDQGVVSSMVKTGVRAMLLRTTDEDAFRILQKNR